MHGMFLSRLLVSGH